MYKRQPVITAKGYDNVYVLDGTTAAINGDVSHAYVYGGARVNFNNNVDTLEMCIRDRIITFTLVKYMATDTDAGQSFHWGTEIHAIAYIRHSGDVYKRQPPRRPV